MIYSKSLSDGIKAFIIDTLFMILFFITSRISNTKLSIIPLLERFRYVIRHAYFRRHFVQSTDRICGKISLVKNQIDKCVFCWKVCVSVPRWSSLTICTVALYFRSGLSSISAGMTKWDTNNILIFNPPPKKKNSFKGSLIKVTNLTKIMYV